MNRTFAVKMMQAKKLQYEAMKEIMPEALAKRVTSLENEIFELGKEFFMSAMTGTGESSQSEEMDNTVNKPHKITIE